MNPMIQHVALIASIVLPLWNIPLIVRIVKRRSSDDISLFWALGVWICLLVMIPAGILSSDIVMRVFVIANVTIFRFVVGTVIFYRFKKKEIQSPEDAV